MTAGPPTTRKSLAQMALLAACYVGAARFGVLLAWAPGNIAAVFPPAGIALAALLLGGLRLWPGIWVGSFVASLWFVDDVASPFATSPASAAVAAAAMVAAGSTLQAVVGVLLIRRVALPVRLFARPSDVARFTAVGASICMIGTTIGVTTLRIAGFASWSGYGMAWFMWYLGDLVGVLLLTPLVVSWSGRAPLRWSTARGLEAALLATATVAVAWFILAAPFRSTPVAPVRGYYLLIPLIAWAAVRFGQRGVTLTAAAASAIAIGTAMRLSAAASLGTAGFLISLQMFSSIAVLTGLLLATAIEDFEKAESELRAAHGDLERRVVERTTELARANDTLREREALLNRLFEEAPDAILVVGDDGRVIRANTRAWALFGWSASEIVGQALESLLSGSAGARVVEQEHLEASDADERGRRKDGSEFPADVMLSPLETSAGKMMIVIVRDRTHYRRIEEQLRRGGEQLRALAARVQEVREQERTRMAREVHDELGQALTGLKMELGWVAKQLAAVTDDERKSLAGRVRESTQLIDEMIDSVRRIASDLRPGVLDDLGLVAAIEWQARDFERRTGIVCDVAAVNDVPLDRDVATAVFRIFQEILTNVARHAGGSRVEASLSRVDAGAILEVRDDGRGITDEELAGRQSLGLLGMRERAVIFGGDVRVANLPGGGTCVTVTIPRTRVPAATEGILKSGERSV
ncbi:MAG: MASE1 domain-containing protein [bacterium]